MDKGLLPLASTTAKASMKNPQRPLKTTEIAIIQAKAEDILA